jgi:Sec-independent protein translocase protein TatA
MIRPGPLEIGLIIVVILMVFGAGKLPQLFEMLGSGWRKVTGKNRDEAVEVETKRKKKSKKG